MANYVRWNPFREMAAMQSALDRIFEESWRNAYPTGMNNALAFDVHETDQAYTIVTAIPGINPDNIDIRYHEGTLSIGAEIAKPEIDENTNVLLQERAYGTFGRSVTLPQPVNADNAEANYENGVLTLTLPKVEAVQPKQISVKTSNLLQGNNN